MTFIILTIAFLVIALGLAGFTIYRSVTLVRTPMIEIDYKGFLNKEGMIALLEHSNIGASTLLNVGQYDKIDTLPTKVYDYMAMELPVILSNTAFAKKNE